MYHEFFPEAVFNKRIEDAYLRADFLLCLPLSNKLEPFKRIENVGLMVRQINYKQAKEIRDRIGRDKKLIYIGLGKSVNLEYLKKIKFSQYRGFNFLFSAGTEVIGDNIFTIPKDDLETQNYIAACDYIITKAGWSTIAEAIQAHIPLLIIKRDNIIEDRIMIREIERLKIGRAIDINEFEELKIRDYLMKLDELKVNYQYLDNRFKNNSYQIAKQIWQLI